MSRCFMGFMHSGFHVSPQTLIWVIMSRFTLVSFNSLCFISPWFYCRGMERQFFKHLTFGWKESLRKKCKGKKIEGLKGSPSLFFYFSPISSPLPLHRLSRLVTLLQYSFRHMGGTMLCENRIRKRLLQKIYQTSLTSSVCNVETWRFRNWKASIGSGG